MSVYNRKAAVTYAKTYALNPNPDYKFFYVFGEGGGDCTNFVSQCLHAGNIPMEFNPQSQPWWYNRVNNQWSISWAVAHSFYWTLKVRNEKKLTGLKGLEIKDISSLELGDVICYENYNGMVYHSAIITGFQGGEPLITQHTFNALDIPYTKYKAKKAHYMKISG
ncbi:MAG: amidase domain-containing protein [Clostridiaceae bacterium]